ncbi:MAG TPA: T9SS type A sorting domain-containing protein [Lacibacter sp.]|nr:T9SS type A sorting domain-containing protein [Lacibacter sp.]
MNKYVAPAFLLLFVSSALFFAVTNTEQRKSPNREKLTQPLQLASEKEQEGGYKRWLHEWTMLHDPATGEIPRDIYRKEQQLLSNIQQVQRRSGFRTTINNTYETAGPSQNGGRSRAVAYDMRGNQIMIAGGVSGGIFRSTNGGSTWTYVHPTNQSRIISCIAQDPRPGFQDTWYAGTGELFGPSPSYPNAFIPGNGIFKSTDNGVTWTKLASTSAGTAAESFDDLFDIIFNIQVDNNGHVYAAILNYVLRSTDGGNTWGAVLASTSDPNSSDIEGLATDVVIAKNSSKYYAAFSGRNTDAAAVGVWQSSNGTSWTRVAGAPSGQGFVNGWRAYNNTVSGGVYTAGWGKTVLAVAPSNANILWVMYDNAQSASNNLPEADLWRADLTGTPVWSNRTSGLNALQDGTTTVYMELQGGYNMLLAVHPTNPELVLAGGVNLFRSTDGFQSVRRFIGGLESTTYNDPTFASHVDFHSFSFDPNNPNRVVIASDGGLGVISNITATTPAWGLLSSNFQTYQFYHVAIDPTPGARVFAGGAQDNSTTYLDTKGLLDPPLPDPNDHYVGLIGGDGGMVALSPSTAISQFLYCSAQEGILVRAYLENVNTTVDLITPDGAPPGNFVTYYHLDNDNTNILYYVADDRLWRTTNATTVTSTTGWTEMTGVATALTGDIYALATTRGAYNTSNSYLYIGTSNGRIFRINNPRDAAPSTTPVNISPTTGMTTQSLVREIAVHPTNPDIVLAVVSNYGAQSAFFTTNATSATPTWQLVEGNIGLSSFRSCAIVATASGTEYYVGTSIGLFSTTAMNGPSTVWTLEGNSVMQGAIISDLVLRTADNTLLVGTHGNGMFVANIGNVATPVTNVTTNDKTFISAVTETVTRNSIYFQRGTQTGINKINVQVLNANGQVVYRRDMPYSNGSVDVSRLATGVYILDIWSDNKKFRHTQKFVKAQ